jgi:hypothetical protein
MGGIRYTFDILAKTCRKKPTGRSRRRWEDNIRMYLRKYGGRGWTGCILLTLGTSGGFL